MAFVVQLPPELGVENPQRFAMGGMAELFRGEKVFAEFGRVHVVVKHLLPQYIDEPELILRFRDEARVGLALRHKNIARVYEYREVDHHHFLVMEEIEGRSVKQLVLDCRRFGVRFSQDVAAHILGCVAEALTYVSEARTPEGESLNLIHRDISPSNILVGRDGQAKLIDFGVAQATGREAHTATGHLVGKYAYMSPEQVMDQKLDTRADLFGLGVVGYEMLTGRNPFQGTSELDTFNLVLNVDPVPLSVARSELHPMLMAAVEQCIEKDREARFAHPRLLLSVLQRYLTRVPDSPPVDRTVAFLERLTELREADVSPAEVATVVTVRRDRTDSLAPVASANPGVAGEPVLERFSEPTTEPGTPPPAKPPAGTPPPAKPPAGLPSADLDDRESDEDDTLKIRIRKRKRREQQAQEANKAVPNDLRLRPRRRQEPSGEKGERRWGHPVELWRHFEARPPRQRIGIMIGVGLGMALFLWIIGVAITGGGSGGRSVAGRQLGPQPEEDEQTDPMAEIVVEDEPVLPYRGPSHGLEINGAEVEEEVTPDEEKDATPISYGTISIHGSPAAEVWVDGEYVGMTPVRDLQLTAGEHELTFRNRKLNWSRTDKVKISSGPNREIRLSPRQVY